MKRLFTIVLSTIIIAGLYAQGFTELNTMLEAVSESSVAFADVDGDMDQDILISGRSQIGGRVAKLYQNNGSGQYTEMATPFTGVVSGAVAFADTDGDTDQDVLLTGGAFGGEFPFAQLYTNDGSGQYTAVTTPFIGVVDGAVAFADIDGDMDQDLIITGQLSNSTPVTRLHVNNGGNQFSEVATSLPNVRSGSLAFADVDGDMDQDLLLTGRGSSETIASLYINDGNGQFTESSSTFPGVRFSSVAFADVDGDTDQDLLLTGLDSNFDRIVKLYTNNGSGQFTEQTGTPFTAATRGSIAFADVDGDTDQDVIITGDGTGFNNPSTKLYINDGSGQFTEEPNTPFADVLRSSVAFADLNGDFAPDLLITGESNGGNALTKFYANDGFDCFAQITSQTDISCNGGADGTITVSAVVGTEPYTYSWSNGASLATITGLSAGMYTVTVTDAEGCEAIATTTLTEPEPLSITTSTTSETAANVTFDGTASGAASGGTPPYSYQWSNDATGSFIFGLSTGVYNLTVMDANGCTATGTALVGPCAPVVNSINLVDCGNGVSGNVTLEVDGELNGAAQWQWLGLNQDCENPSFIHTTGPTITANYFDYINTEFIVRAVGGCLNAPVCFTFVPSDLTGEPAELSLSETTFCQGEGVQTGLGGGSPAGGVYSGPGVTDDGNGMTFSFDPDAVGLGSSSITYTYDTGTACGDSEAEVMIQVGTLPDATFTAPGPFNTDAGLQPLTGGLPAGGTYSGDGVVNNGDGTFSFDPSIGAGTYTITYTVTGSTGCTAAATADLVVEDCEAPTFTSTLMDVCEDAGVQSGLGGGMPEGGVYSGPGVTDDGNGMTFSFDPAVAGVGTQTVTYTVTSSNIDQEQVSASSFAPESVAAVGPFAQSFIPAATQICGAGVLVSGNSSGDLTIALWDALPNATGANMLASSTVAATADNYADASWAAVDVLPGNTYYLVLTGGDNIFLGFASADPYPNGQAYDSNSSPYSPFPDIDLAFRTLNCSTIPCTAEATADIEVLAGLMVDAVVTSNYNGADISCNGAANGQAVVSTTGGTGSYTTAWSNGATTMVATGLAAGTYSVTVTDANGCDGTASVTLTEPDPISVTFTIMDDTGVMDGSITASTTGGISPYTYMWSNGQTGNSLFGLAGGDYTVTVTDANGCTGSETATVVVEMGGPENDMCGGAIDINLQFGQTPGEVQSSGPYDNTNATTDDSDPGFGWECFGEPDGNGSAPSLERTLWYTFEGDGNSYFIEALACGEDPIDFGDTQFVIYAGPNCDSLEAVLCSEDGPNATDGFFPAGDTLQTEAGVTYYIMVDGFGPDFAADGEFCMEVTQIAPPVQTASVTFQVDASGLLESGTLSPEGILVAGEFNGWPGFGTPMTEGADNIWSVTLELPANDTFEYKFQNGPDGWENIDESFGDPCTLGDFGNRFVVVEEAAVVTDLVCFNYCVTCDLVVGIDENALQAGIKVFPNPVRDILNVQLDLPSATESLQIRLLNMLGQEVFSGNYGQLQSDNIELDVNELPTGAYLIQVRDGKAQFTEPIVIQQ